MKIFFKIFILFLALLVLFPSYSASAQNLTPDFQHNVVTNYNILPDKSANVSYTFKTVNRINNNYLRSFTFRLPFEPINIQVNDSPTKIRVKNLQKVSAINIFELEIDFLNPVFGKDKVFDWTFSFNIKNIILPHGSQNAVVIPTFANDTDINSYNITVNMPKVFGEIKYIYGNAGITDTALNYLINFTATRNKTSNVLILTGGNQQYQLEISTNDEEKAKVFLPQLASYQQSFFTEFPKREITLNTKTDLTTFELLKEEKISGIIDTNNAKDEYKGKSKIFNTESEVFKRRLQGLSLENLSTKQKAEKVYLELIRNYQIDQFNLAKNLSVNITDDKINVNIEEINLIYRQYLGLLGIESRGAYGYVFPIQPFAREEYFVEQHIWTEFWDGNEWIWVDPVWLISSRGTSYFDNNRYHHIKFGEYFDIEEVLEFIDARRFIKLTPLKEIIDLEKTGNIEIRADADVYLNKELFYSFTNNTNYPVLINSISFRSNDEGVRIITDISNEDIVIFPGSSFSTPIKLEYGFVLLNREYNFDNSVNKFTDNSNPEEIKNTLNTQIQSNISNYLTYIIIAGFIILGGLSLFGLSFYKARK